MITILRTVLYAITAAGVTAVALGLYSISRIFIGGKIGKARNLHSLDNEDL